MAGNNSNLGAAKGAKNDEFYTQYSDIEAEMNVYVEFNPDVFRGKTLLGSAASGEGLVNVYRGTGRVLMMPVRGSRLSFPTVE